MNLGFRKTINSTGRTAWLQKTPLGPTLPLYVAAILSVLHSLATAQAAPTMFSQLKVEDDDAALATIFNRFEFWQTARCILQVLNFVATLWGLVTIAVFAFK